MLPGGPSLEPTPKANAGEHVRAFVAVDAAEELRAPIEALQDRLRSAGADVKWVDSHQFHITLKFLGDVAVGDVAAVVDAVKGAVASVPSFQMCLHGVGAFPSARQPRAVWIGATDGADAMAELAKAVDDALSPLGFERERRPFRSHLTLGRVRSDRGIVSLARRLNEEQHTAIGTMRVQQVVVMRSVLTPKGPIYTRLGLAPLKETRNR